MLVRSGSILPLREYEEAIAHGSASRPFTSLVLVFYPGSLVASAAQASDPSTSSTPMLYPSLLLSSSVPSAAIPLASTWLYEDDGMSEDYQRDIFTNTSIFTTFTPFSLPSPSFIRGCSTISIATVGAFQDMPVSRTYTLRLLSLTHISSVTINETPLPQSSIDGQADTYYIDRTETRVYLSAWPLSRDIAAVVCM